MSAVKVGSIVELDANELTPGLLSRRFSEGAAIAVIKNHPLAQQTWNRLLHDPDEQLPWQAPLVDIARNHYAGGGLGGNLGDMFYFTPRRLAYIARKFELERETEDGQIRCIPEIFHQGAGQFSPHRDTTNACWLIADQIMQAMIPPDRAAPSYRVVVHRLKYEDRRTDIDNLYSLSENAVGRWAQFGSRIDRRREDARGPLAAKGVSDLFAIFSLVAPLRRALDLINNIFSRRDPMYAKNGSSTLIGKPHYDKRYFSSFCGARSSVRTEALIDGAWIELKFGVDHLVVLPGLLARKHLGVKPVLHRILHHEPVSEPAEYGAGGGSSAALKNESADNVTLVFGAK